MTQPRQLLSTAAQVEETHAHLQVVQNLLSDRINAQRSRWISPRADSFYAAYTQFDKQFEDIKQRLEDIHSTMVGTGRLPRQPRPHQSTRGAL